MATAGPIRISEGGSRGAFFECAGPGSAAITCTTMICLKGLRQRKELAIHEEIKFAVGQTSLGAILIASSAKGIAAILLGDDLDELVRDLQDRFAKARFIGADRNCEDVVARVVGFVEAPRIGLSLSPRRSR
jgi:hypothetical protein